VIAFACYVTLQHRVGPGAASTVGVMTPVFALVISALFEGFVPVLLTWIGAALAVAGNVLILRPRWLKPGASRAAG
jgi:drug/metabolite transporter (DMT)-like permease